MPKYPNMEFPIDVDDKAGAVKGWHGGTEFVIPGLDGSSVAVPVTSTALAANATFTGSSRDRLNLTEGATQTTTPLANIGGVLVTKVKYTVFADQAGTLYLDESNDNATWTQTATLSVPAGQFIDTGWVTLTKRYRRPRYVNGATAQTTFALFASSGAGQIDSSLSGSNVTLATAVTTTGLQTSAAQTVGGAYSLMRLNIWGTATSFDVQVQGQMFDGTWYTIQGSNSLNGTTVGTDIIAAGVYDFDVSSWQKVALNVVSISGGNVNAQGGLHQ